jgi:CHAT domain
MQYNKTSRVVLKPEWDLRFSLEGAELVVEGKTFTEKYPSRYFFSDVDDAVKGTLQRLKDAIAAQVGTPFSQKRIDELRDRGRKLFVDALQRTASPRTPLEDLLTTALQGFNENHPVRIWVEGDLGYLPWEAIVLPAHVSPTGVESWLGEIAIVAAVPHQDPQGMPYYAAARQTTLSSAWGHDAHLPYLVQEKQAMSRFVRRGLVHQNVNTLPATKGANGARLVNAVAQASAQLSDELTQPNYPALFHFACHNSPPTPGGYFRLHLFDGSEVQGDELMANKFKLAHPHITFLNICNGAAAAALTGARTSLADWRNQGMVDWLIERQNALAVVASSTKLSDQSAAAFSERFLGNFLPNPIGRGLPIGLALQRARVALWGKGDVTGLCYRLFGQHQYVISRRRRTASSSARVGADA